MNGNTDNKYRNIPAECTFLKACVDRGIAKVNDDGTFEASGTMAGIYEAVHDLLPVDLTLLRDGNDIPVLQEICTIIDRLDEGIDSDEEWQVTQTYMHELHLRRMALSVHITVCAAAVEACLPTMFSLAACELSYLSREQNIDIGKPLHRMAEGLTTCASPLAELKTGVVMLGRPDLTPLVGSLSAAEDFMTKMGFGQDDRDEDEDDGEDDRCTDSDGWEYKIN